MLKKRLFSIACAITIATAMCAVTGCGSSKSSGASQQGAGKVDYSALPKIDMPDKKIVLLTQSEEKATTYKEHYGGEVESILVSDKEIFTRFMTMVMSEERVDVFWNYLKPALATQGYLKNLDEYIDFNQPLWADVKDINNLLQDKEGKHYCAIPGVQRNMCLWYNTEIFEEYGLDTPESYVKAGILGLERSPRYGDKTDNGSRERRKKLALRHVRGRGRRFPVFLRKTYHFV